MAFAYSENEDGEYQLVGTLKMKSGTFTNGGSDTGGDIDTGLRRVLYFGIQQTGSAVVTNAPVVNETMPLDGGVVTVVTDADADGTWVAIGE